MIPPAPLVRASDAGRLLPAPQRERWQPLRSGVLNLYRYDYEEFHFADGRLLLRGNNGSGKSRILALQLPFLLDGEASPARVEPDGDPAKRIEWNLLMGRHQDRTGYTWIEFGRRDAAGGEHFLTLGCGLRAVAGQSGLHSRWFFITSQRVGRDLFLQTPQRIPLGRERLTATLGGGGRVFQKVDDYRRAVDESLFGLGPRYQPLLELLLRLRRPQLSRKLEEEELSRALSDALPTLASTIIDEVAESFRSLEADRDALRAFAEARSAVELFLREYRIYARIAVRRQAGTVRSTHSAYESAQRSARDAESRLAAAETRRHELDSRHSELANRFAGADSAARTLRESPEMRTASEIQHARDAALQATDALTQARKDEDDANNAFEQALSRKRRAEEEFAEVSRKLDESRRATDTAAHAADFSSLHRSHFSTAADESTAAHAVSAERELRRGIDHRHEAIETLVRREKAVAEAAAALARADEERQRTESAASEAREKEHQARIELDSAGEALAAAYAAWSIRVRHLQPVSADSLADTLAVWIEQRVGSSPIQAACVAAEREANTRFSSRASGLEREHEELTGQLREVADSIAQLEQGGNVQPPPPPTRGSARTGRAGAPLWRTCDFRPEVAPETRAGFEAALQSSGLLDAWILPDGRVLAGEDDAFLLAEAGSAEGLPEASLDQVLTIALDETDAGTRTLFPETVRRVLARIGARADSGFHWVAENGRWQLGPLTGRWCKPAAEYIGESTRAATRRRQLAALRARLGELQAAAEQNANNRATLARDRVEASTELAAAPTDNVVREAGFALVAATQAITAAGKACERASEFADARRGEWTNRGALRDADAADLRLTPWLGRLDELARHTHHYATTLAAYWPTARHAAGAREKFSLLETAADEAGAGQADRRMRREQQAAATEAVRQRFATLQATHGQTVAAVLGRLTEAERELKQIQDEQEQVHRDRIACAGQQAKAKADREHAEQARATHEDQRRAAIERAQNFAGHRLFAEADAALALVEAAGWSVAHAVDLARRIETLLADTPDDDASWQRRQDSIIGNFQELRDRLIPHGHQPETQHTHEVVTVHCLFQGRPHSMTELHDGFTAELTERQRLLQAREREIIENHLLAEVAVELQKLIRAAEDWRASANAELEERPTSSGVRFRFQWEADTESRFHEVRPIVLRKGELWTPTERMKLAAFLQARIAAQQATDQSVSWPDHLARALDYRRWHRFTVERHQDGQWKRLTKATYGTGSGGEKALALTLPRFAAAAAHYRSAGVTAPRLVLLDEAFAGIDPTMRGQCMGVLTQFDLDVMMTSEQEWGCYRSVPALAIYHLTTLPGLEAVAASRWVWNGREKRRDELPAPQAAPANATDAGNEDPKASGRFTLEGIGDATAPPAS